MNKLCNNEAGLKKALFTKKSVAYKKKRVMDAL